MSHKRCVKVVAGEMCGKQSQLDGYCAKHFRELYGITVTVARKQGWHNRKVKPKPVREVQLPDPESPEKATRRRRVVKEPRIEYDIVVQSNRQKYSETKGTYVEALCKVVEMGSDAIDFRSTGQDRWYIKPTYLSPPDTVWIERYSVVED